MIVFLPNWPDWQECSFRSILCQMKKRVVLVGFDGAEGLDLFGPAEVFTGAGRRLGAAAYEVVLASERGGPIALTSGASVSTRGWRRSRKRSFSTTPPTGQAARLNRRMPGRQKPLEWGSDDGPWRRFELQPFCSKGFVFFVCGGRATFAGSGVA